MWRRLTFHTAGLVARGMLAAGALDRPDLIVTAASVVAAVAGFVLIVTTGG